VTHPSFFFPPVSQDDLPGLFGRSISLFNAVVGSPSRVMEEALFLRPSFSYSSPRHVSLVFCSHFSSECPLSLLNLRPDRASLLVLTQLGIESVVDGRFSRNLVYFDFDHVWLASPSLANGKSLSCRLLQF